jgi:hypothetical protein
MVGALGFFRLLFCAIRFDCRPFDHENETLAAINTGQSLANNPSLAVTKVK